MNKTLYRIIIPIPIDCLTNFCKKKLSLFVTLYVVTYLRLIYTKSLIHFIILLGIY